MEMLLRVRWMECVVERSNGVTWMEMWWSAGATVQCQGGGELASDNSGIERWRYLVLST